MRQRLINHYARQLGQSMRQGKRNYATRAAFMLSLLAGSADGMPRFSLYRTVRNERHNARARG